MKQSMCDAPMTEGDDPNPRGRGPIPVLFWGIIDLKYDPRLSENERLQVLEVGDGLFSRFSHHGKEIQEKFQSQYAFEIGSPLKRALLTEN